MRPREDILATLSAFVTDQLLDGEYGELTETTPLLKWGVIDSLSMLVLISFIEDDFEVHVPDDEVRPEQFETLGRLADLLMRLQKQEAARGGSSAAETAASIEIDNGLTRDRTDLGSGIILHSLRAPGAGPTWLMLPPPGQPASVWGALMRASMGAHDLVAVDLPGFGLSRWPGDPPSLRDHVNAVEALVATLPGREFVIVASSISACIAAELAEREPGRVKALVVEGFGVTGDADAWWSRYRELAAVPERYLEKTSYGRLESSSPTSDAIAEGLRCDALSWFLQPDDLAGVDAAFDALACPTLVIGADNDALVPASSVTAAANRLQRARLEWLPRCGHFPHLERPQELLQLIVRFLDDLDGMAEGAAA